MWNVVAAFIAGVLTIMTLGMYLDSHDIAPRRAPVSAESSR